MDAKFISKQQYSSDLWPSKDKRKLYIVEKSLKIIKRIKNSVRLILDNCRIVGYPFLAVYQWIHLTFRFILIVC